jgi:hypothetical protein
MAEPLDIHEIAHFNIGEALFSAGEAAGPPGEVRKRSCCAEELDGAGEARFPRAGGAKPLR